MKIFIKSLYIQVIIAVILGIIVGHFWPETAVSFKPLGDGFIKLIKMMIAPLVFCTVVTGIAGMENMKHAGRVGVKALIYFEVITTLALIIGLVVVNLQQPGVGMHIDPETLDASSITSYTSAAAENSTIVGSILHIIPKTFTSAFVEGDMLQILLIAILFAIGLVMVGERGSAIYNIIQQGSEILFKIIGLIVKLAPLGAFGAMAFTIGQYGLSSLQNLLSMMLGFYFTCAVFVFVILGLVMRMTGLRLLPFLKYIGEEILLVLGTSSSESALTRLMEKMQRLGCRKQVVGMVVPTGYSFNLDGTSIYLTMAAIFIAQALDIDLSLGDQLLLLSVLLITAKGAAGVTGSGFVVLAGSLAAVGHIPAEGLALILGIDRFMSEARAITNLIGNGVATVAVSKWEKAIDMDVARKALGLEESKIKRKIHEY